MNNIESKFESKLPATGSTLDNLKSGIGRTAAGAHAAIKDATDAMHPVVDTLAASSHIAVDKSCDIATHAADAVKVKGEELRNTQARLTETASKYVRAHPLMVLGVAVAVGFAGSRLLSRSS